LGIQTYKQGPKNFSPILDLPAIQVAKLGFLIREGSLISPGAKKRLSRAPLYVVGVALGALIIVAYLTFRTPFKIASLVN
jgi:hypothetical protein